MLYRLIVTLGSMVVIFGLSSIPGDPRPEDSAFVWLVAKTPSFIQKIGHLVSYGGLSWLWFWTLEGVLIRPHYRIVAAFLIAAGFGAFNEWYQTHVPGRFGSVVDVILNSVGAALGLLIALLWSG